MLMMYFIRIPGCCLVQHGLQPDVFLHEMFIHLGKCLCYFKVLPLGLPACVPLVFHEHSAQPIPNMCLELAKIPMAGFSNIFYLVRNHKCRWWFWICFFTFTWEEIFQLGDSITN